MKKLILVLLTIVMVFSLAACSSSSNTPADKSEPAKAAFTPKGEKVTSKGGTVSVLAPTNGDEMWQGIEWQVDPNYTDNSIYIAAKDLGSLLYVHPSIWVTLTGKYDTVEKMEAALASGEYAEWYKDFGTVEPVTIEGIALYDRKTNSSPKQTEHLMIKDGKVYGIQSRCDDEAHREVYENLLKQVLLTIE